MKRMLLIIATLVLGCTACAGSITENDYLIKEAELPEIPNCPDMSDPSNLDDKTLSQFNAWRNAKAEWKRIIAPDLELFTSQSTRKLALNYKKKNLLYSPVSLWFCLETLTELTEGNTLSQIQNVTGKEKQLDPAFKSLYWQDEETVCTPAISLWLNSNTSISSQLLEKLSCTSVFQGKMGDTRYDKALQSWLNEQTRGLLKDSVSDLGFSPDVGLSICSSIYMKSGWSTPFFKEETTPDVFHSEKGDITTDFMHSSNPGVIYQRDGFSAAVLDFQDGGGVTFFLPYPSLSPEELLNSDEMFDFLFTEREWGEGEYGKINLSIPKIDLMGDLSLKETLGNLGIVNIFDICKAQFADGLSSETNLSLPDIHQYTRLILNEDGVEAAAITISYEGGLHVKPEEEIDFSLDRPFLFAVMSEKKIPLFIGMYYQPSNK